MIDAFEIACSVWTSKKMLTLRYMVEPKPNIPPYLSILTRLTSVLSRL